MSGYDSLIENLGKRPIFASNVGLGETGAILARLNKAILICPNIEKARNIKSQLDALNKDNVIIDDFSKPFTLAKFQSDDNKYDIISAMYRLTFFNTILITTPEIFYTILPNLKNFNKNIIKLTKNSEIDLINLEKQLINLGYTKTESVNRKGEFARRGDIIDIFNTLDENPTRLDFFDTNLDDIYEFDFLTFEKKNKKNNLIIAPNKLNLLENKEKINILKEINNLKQENNIFFDLFNLIERDEDFPLEFVLPFCNFNVFYNFNIPITFYNYLEIEPKIAKLQESILERIEVVFKNENLIKIYENSIKKLNFNNFLTNFLNNLIFFENFNIENTNLKLKIKNYFNINFKTINFSNFLNNLVGLNKELTPYANKKVYLCLSSANTLNSIKKIFTDLHINYSLNKNSKGIILTELNIPYNICFEEDNIFYIGTTNFAHKKEIKKQNVSKPKYLPKAGEYVVHNVHGIGKCEGMVTINAMGVDKEFFKITYLKGDTLYVPYESADSLSLYMADDNSTVKLNKLGGKEFAGMKLRAIKSIEDMSKELIELYAKRKAEKGFKYDEDDYLYTEFEAAFNYEETADQLQAIQDVKRDMISGKVMDRLICGDVGFGKTEVAMRALFKAVEAGKQVAILAPTTILSLQHFLSTKARCENFGVTVEMLNRFKTSKEQKSIISALKEGKINVICGTHRLLSKDVSFADLGLLILDEEQRFGVKAKEQIKQLKTNVDVLTLSATPIPRTLSMSLMNIRDISIINTPPVNRLPVKTYVLAFNEDIIANAINDEINRNGQVLVVFNNVEKIYAFKENLKRLVNNKNAIFDVAHGQMDEHELENTIKRLYEKQTNVFVSTTLIENGIDLPKANTLVVVDSDKLGLSQMYQLRGRVGRSAEQAYAYFTYGKNKVLTEEASSRLQAIAENTELGSGFKIAMRDLQIRGAGELLGKVQHGHIVKIGYDMYMRLLNETLRRISGEKVEIEREIKIDVALPTKIPYTFIENEAERLKVIAKISNINSKETARAILNELLTEYGKLPNEIYNLTNIALLKALAVKQNVKQIVINKTKMSIVFYEDVGMDTLLTKVNKQRHFKFEKASLPTIFLQPKEFSVITALTFMIEFLS